ncbi:hypothetical protein [Massilibacteroides sp.]|uniref:hypothetical protein n=1 Tax=Massilibacteroides sp. TaxID=2034766 RepID=UPI002637D8BF|nr:hypothetical protein [Massilibacteroides sp.]MDD4515410.1 hypothetical protein [Massilibacteroides sp.]
MINLNTIKTLELTLDGSPWCKINSSPNINVNTLEYTLDGSPWWGHTGEIEPVTSSGNIKRIIKVNWANAKTVSKAIGH